MKKSSENKPEKLKKIGPDAMTPSQRKSFFAFYKRNESRRLFGFFKDVARSSVNNTLLSKYLQKHKDVKCLVAGCSHWANPLDLNKFLRGFNKEININIVALDVLPEALIEAIKHKVLFTPLLTPAQNTPFLDCYFDIVVADGLLNCCSFEQHNSIVKELYRVAKKDAMIILGLGYSKKRLVLKSKERSMTVYCRPFSSIRGLFLRRGFYFPKNSSVGTIFGDGKEIKIDNCIAIKR